jgi:hypothetical protein
MPVARGGDREIQAPDEPAQALPTKSLAAVVPDEDDLADEPTGHDPARAAGEAAAAATFGQEAADAVGTSAIQQGGKRALIQYDYEKAEDNELELQEGEYVTNIDMVDDDWWMGQNSRGETGLFPSNYVELVDDDDDDAGPQPGQTPAPTGPEPAEASPAAGGDDKTGPWAIAQYDYEAAEDNELSFPDGAKITDLVSDDSMFLTPVNPEFGADLLLQEFPDEDWWFGHCEGREGLFPANYVELQE